MRNTKLIIVGIVILALLIALSVVIGVLIGERQDGVSAMYRLALRFYQDDELERAQILVDEILLYDPTHRKTLALQENIQQKRDALAALSQNNQDTVQTERAAQDSVAAADDTRSAAISAQPKQISQAEQQRAAEQRLQQTTNQDRERAQKIEALLTAGTEYLNRKQFNAARSEFNKVFEEQLIDQALQNRYASIALARIAESFRQEADKMPEQLQTARQYAYEAQQTDSENWEGYYVDGLIAADANDVRAAIAAQQRALGLNPRNADILFALANAYYRAQQYQNARDSYVQTLAIDEKYPNAHHNLGTTYIRLNATAQAEETFLAGARYYTQDPRLQYRIGSLAYDARRYTQAQQHLKLAIQYDPQNALYYGKLGSAQIELSNFQGALQSFREAVRIDALNPTWQYNLAVVYNQLGNYQLGLPAIENALRYTTDNAEYYYTFGQILGGLSNTNEAIAAFQKALTINDRYANALSEIGRLYIESGDISSGIQFMERAFAIDPLAPIVNNNLGNAYLLQNENQTAINYFLTAVRSQPRNINFQYNLALAYIENSQLNSALKRLQMIIDIDTMYWLAYQKIGEIHIALGDKEQSRLVLQGLLRDNPNYTYRGEVENLLKNL